MWASVTPATRSENPCRQVPRCHANRRWMSPGQVPRLRRLWNVNATKCYVCHIKWRGAPGGQRRQSVPPEPVKCNKCHACLAKRGSMSPSATPATQRGAAPRATNTGDQTRHQRQPSATSATPAAPNAGRCRQMQRLPRQTQVDVARASPVPYVPRWPRKTKVDVAKCQAWHAFWKSMPPSATQRVCACAKVVCERWCVKESV